MELCQLLPSQFNKSLNLSSKQITRIGKLVQNSPFLNLQHLHISHNNISNLDGIEQFKQLKSLSLSNNQMVDINELKKVNRNLQYLSIHSNPFTVYDYHDVCYHLFRQLKRLDGMAVDMRIVKSQRIQAEVVSRWLIPWIYQLNNQMLNIQKVLSLRNATKELDQRSQLKTVSNDLLLQIDWQFIDRMLSFLGSSTLQNLSKLLQSLQYNQELDQAQTKEMKKIHYETFQDVIKLQSSNHYAAFIDYLIRLNDGDKTNYYKVFLNIQKPQLHISSDLYPKDDDLIPQEQPQKIIQTVPTFLKDKIKCQEVISNTYRKQRAIPDYEKELFFQYFPVFPFRQEYIQSILQIAILKLTELKNLVSQVAYLKQTAIQSVPQSVRTLRKKQKVSEEPVPQKLNLKPQKPEVSPREDVIQPLEEQKTTTRIYSDVKCEILRQRKAQALSVALEKIFGRRMKRFFGRINNLEQENTRFLDYPQVVYLSSLFYAMKRVLELNKQKRQRQQKKRLMNLAFQGLKLVKYVKQREHKQVNKGYQVLQKLYFKRLVDGIRSMKHLLNYPQKTQKIQPFRLMLREAPFQKSMETIKFRRYNDENNENLKLCSVCTYQF
ncbi:unnamed protein product (macronuclear) [Paramecium tetraurelia]|uniref:Uncharacterized protein n=1 Tax=Paramecium tetraurelia TaxID=5888 RepID=A0C3V2_PARTE|nr:uncharacterized protein GSPATT00034948001 [Paramecium tetraurelia]CAK65469.1 unnamed protein product [Paramecium tetraurelia]|eukprot:XP_001432866.1 hypothetical protein (macronuclear) [Paramecium tetraurelia strain d4-2]